MKNNEQKKERIRERYKGISEDNLDVIPAIPQDSFYDESKKKRVAVYARVSTDDPSQTSSYELQKNHYTDMVNKRDDWNLIWDSPVCSNRRDYSADMTGKCPLRRYCR